MQPRGGFVIAKRPLARQARFVSQSLAFASFTRSISYCVGAAFLALLILIASFVWPKFAWAQEVYPPESGWYVFNLSEMRSSKQAACSAVTALGGGWTFYEPGSFACGSTIEHCRKEPALSSCHVFTAGLRCPHGGTLFGPGGVFSEPVCIDPPPCPDGQGQDPQTGQCAIYQRDKNRGAPTCGVGNPCNPGTGTKFQVESVYRSGGA